MNRWNGNNIIHANQEFGNLACHVFNRKHPHRTTRRSISHKPYDNQQQSEVFNINDLTGREVAFGV